MLPSIMCLVNVLAGSEYSYLWFLTITQCFRVTSEYQRSLYNVVELKDVDQTKCVLTPGNPGRILTLKTIECLVPPSHI